MDEEQRLTLIENIRKDMCDVVNRSYLENLRHSTSLFNAEEKINNLFSRNIEVRNILGLKRYETHGMVIARDIKINTLKHLQKYNTGGIIIARDISIECHKKTMVNLTADKIKKYFETLFHGKIIIARDISIECHNG